MRWCYMHPRRCPLAAMPSDNCSPLAPYTHQVRKNDERCGQYPEEGRKLKYPLVVSRDEVGEAKGRHGGPRRSPVHLPLPCPLIAYSRYQDTNSSLSLSRGELVSTSRSAEGTSTAPLAAHGHAAPLRCRPARQPSQPLTAPAPRGVRVAPLLEVERSIGVDGLAVRDERKACPGERDGRGSRDKHRLCGRSCTTTSCALL